MLGTYIARECQSSGLSVIRMPLRRALCRAQGQLGRQNRAVDLMAESCELRTRNLRYMMFYECERRMRNRRCVWCPRNALPNALSNAESEMCMVSRECPSNLTIPRNRTEVKGETGFELG